jgi:hypothetical protein
MSCQGEIKPFGPSENRNAKFKTLKCRLTEEKTVIQGINVAFLNGFILGCASLCHGQIPEIKVKLIKFRIIESYSSE